MRCRWRRSGRQVVVVSGGDPGVFAMASAVFEAVETGEPAWRALDIRVEPGVTAMLAAAAEVGAPLGGDFCAISLSDNLKAWATVERRLKAAAEADFVIALYNPASKARPHQLGQAFDLLRAIKAAETPVLFVRAAGTPDVEGHDDDARRGRRHAGRHAHPGDRGRQHHATGRPLGLYAAQRAGNAVVSKPLRPLPRDC